jgi:predicted HAD superfamily hydrolase
MYLPKCAIEAILSKAGIVSISDIPIFLSSEARCTKSRGSLYKRALSELKDAKILHTGDNFHSDVRMAKRFGIQSSYFADSESTRYEKTLYKGRNTLQVRTVVAGASRASRLSKYFHVNTSNVVWSIGANIFGPFLSSYVLWVLLDAKRRGFDRLHFIARDGKIMLEVAQRLESWLKTGIKFCYLYGSRNAWHIPTLSFHDNWPSWVYDLSSTTTLSNLISRIGLSADEAKALVPDLTFNDYTLTSPIISDPLLENYRRIILGSEKVQRLAMAKSLKSRDLLEQYLVEQGAAECKDFVIVDIGWNGRMQLSLNQICKSSDRLSFIKLHGYYLGMTKYPPRAISENVNVYFSEGADKVGACELHENRVLAEIMCRADHGGTLHYSYDDVSKKIVPILQKYKKAFDADWGLDIQRAAIHSFVEHLSAGAQIFKLLPDHVLSHLEYSSALNWQQFIKKPDLAEAEVYGSVTHGHEQTHDIGNRTAYKISSIELLKLLFASPRKSLSYTSWPQATAILSFGSFRALVWSILYNLRMFIIYRLRIALIYFRRFRTRLF